MTITITLHAWVFQLLAAYLLVGILAYVPLNHWAARFISPRRRGLDVWRHIRPRYILPGVAVSAALWPLMVAIMLNDERKRRRRRRGL